VIGYAIDVSHWQKPSALPWDKFEGKVQAVIVRAAYGSELRDKHAREHVRRARLIGAKVGLYIFYRPHHTVQKQFELLCSVAEECKIGPGDVVPTIDVEKDPIPKPGVDVAPSWNGPVHELAQRIDERFGAKCMLYLTQREFGFLGKPAWILEADRPRWVAHYVDGKPATPGGLPVVMHQHRVAPFDPNGPGGYNKKRPELDQNRILLPLPLLGPQAAASGVFVQPANDPADDWDDLDDRRVLELTLTGEELDAMDLGHSWGQDAVDSALRHFSGHDTEPPEPIPDTVRDTRTAKSDPPPRQS
jgi:hypothetical protein